MENPDPSVIPWPSTAEDSVQKHRKYLPAIPLTKSRESKFPLKKTVFRRKDNRSLFQRFRDVFSETDRLANGIVVSVEGDDAHGYVGTVGEMIEAGQREKIEKYFQEEREKAKQELSKQGII